MFESLFVLMMGVISRMAGGGLGARLLDEIYIGFITKPINELLKTLKIEFCFPTYLSLTWLPELAFAVPFGLIGVFGTGSNLFGVLCVAWSYIWMQTGHGVVLPWGRPITNEAFKKQMLGGRTQTLTPIVDWIAKRVGISTERPDGVYSVSYCRLFMAVKGFLIGLPAGGVPLAILWPLAYEIGDRVNSHIVKEFLAGMGAATAILLVYYGT